MDFETLRQMQIQERRNKDLEVINPHFYDEIAEIINPSMETDEDINVLRSKKICATEIILRRIEKIISLAKLNGHRGMDDTDNLTNEIEVFNLTEEELELYLPIVKSIRAFLMKVCLDEE